MPTLRFSNQRSSALENRRVGDADDVASTASSRGCLADRHMDELLWTDSVSSSGESTVPRQERRLFIQTVVPCIMRIVSILVLPFPTFVHFVRRQYQNATGGGTQLTEGILLPLDILHSAHLKDTTHRAKSSRNMTRVGR